jgi:hypothetical protein
MFDAADATQASTPVPFPLVDEPPPRRFGNKGDPYIRAMTPEERSSFIYLRQRYGAAMARRLIQFKRENPGTALPRQLPRRRVVVVEKTVGGWFVGLTSGNSVRIIIDGAVHDLTIREAGEIKAALARIAA